MRNYENSDTSSFNTYRSGRENPRRENSTRSDYTNNQVHRQGSTQATDDHFNRQSLMHHPNDYRNMYQNRGDQNGDNNHQQNQYRPNQNWNQHNNNWQDQNRWPQDNRQNQDNYGNHSQDRDYDRHRSGDRGFFEKAGDRVNETWNRWTNDDDHANRNNHYQNQNTRNNWGNQDRDRDQQHNQHRYSSDYGHQNQTNQGRGYDVDRYSNRRDNYQNNRHEDEGFFDRMGRSIKNAWDEFTQEERDDQNRANRYERDHRQNDSNRNSGRTSGPPYNYGSSSSRDYEW